MNHDDLLCRVQRLERANRRLVCALGLIGAGAALLALAGWRQAGEATEVLRVRRLEVVDPRGVPMVVLDTGRRNEGGAITLRDSGGERRAWWSASPEGSALGLSHAATPESPATTAGLGASAAGAEANLIGPTGAMLSASVRQGKPRVDLWGEKGDVVFAAPWKGASRRP